jgi:hypothetical protein
MDDHTFFREELSGFHNQGRKQARLAILDIVSPLQSHPDKEPFNLPHRDMHFIQTKQT